LLYSFLSFERLTLDLISSSREKAGVLHALFWVKDYEDEDPPSAIGLVGALSSADGGSRQRLHNKRATISGSASRSATG